MYRDVKKTTYTQTNKNSHTHTKKKQSQTHANQQNPIDLCVCGVVPVFRGPGSGRPRFRWSHPSCPREDTLRGVPGTGIALHKTNNKKTSACEKGEKQ